ncbi:hypothetical protein [Amylibacter sp. IMCC11727]|uniref:hypothetical protein n=1 Tax=Amylibacter sp. IMCC11727 TaxID=3039851 RepID=UPI00244DD701|nr:hypothetical protein [Amylibacter sp. IMCC11727]WGI21677.1 hypothetical protein QBD29_16435 [Amylibacter sp. IMCC11727]
MKLFPYNRSQTIRILFIVAIAAVVIRVILDGRFATSALLYLAVPFAVSVLIHQFIPHEPETTRPRQLFNHLRDATVVMLATSFILFEGFICVLMFMPIYYLSVLIHYAFTGHRDPTKLQVLAVPLVVAVLSLEGMFPSTSLPRKAEVTHVAVVDGTIAQLKANMANPIVFQKDRNWFLSIFPLPVSVDAGSLTAGDVHTLDFVYKRWFYTNIHKGTFALEISDVGADFVRTKVVKNTSYLASYVQIDGTEVRFRELDDGQTEVALTIHYHRKLDPAWYFGPMQSYAFDKSAAYLIDTVIARK